MSVQLKTGVRGKDERTDYYDENERVTLAVAEYDRTRRLLDGSVTGPGIRLVARDEPVGEFCRKPVYELYDAAEMSLSWYLMAQSRGEPVIALPIFPLRMWVHAFLFCRSEDPYVSSADLVGKRIGVPRYRFTVNLWMRGILQDQYGVRPEECLWITTEEEGAGFVPPKGLSVTLQEGRDLEEMLINRDVDFLLLPTMPKLFQKGDSRIRRLFPDCVRVIRSYFSQSKIFPITHTVVMGKSLWEQKSWIAVSLFDAFKRAQIECDRFNSDHRRVSFVEAQFLIEDERARFGPNPWAHGVEANRHVLETFVRYAQEQGYIRYQAKLEQLFAANTLSL